eukprot:CAMPEP_0114135430 /NCGR_PEP_ID=MMETSP0043_2-20121206/14692_1 /TAXON_ID=464988 /ORGANISM="Hemiselmis andersenii, Strain CCMP644" /LENGTH=109 /DNA_ID=CAMNT_0001229147 /DNA_START=51 /DNA_END=377 /DNA_ORIENTATION=-
MSTMLFSFLSRSTLSPATFADMPSIAWGGFAGALAASKLVISPLIPSANCPMAASLRSLATIRLECTLTALASHAWAFAIALASYWSHPETHPELLSKERTYDGGTTVW